MISPRDQPCKHNRRVKVHDDSGCGGVSSAEEKGRTEKKRDEKNKLRDNVHGKRCDPVVVFSIPEVDKRKRAYSFVGLRVCTYKDELLPAIRESLTSEFMKSRYSWEAT